MSGGCDRCLITSQQLGHHRHMSSFMVLKYYPFSIYQFWSILFKRRLTIWFYGYYWLRSKSRYNPTNTNIPIYGFRPSELLMELVLVYSNVFYMLRYWTLAISHLQLPVDAKKGRAFVSPSNQYTLKHRSIN